MRRSPSSPFHLLGVALALLLVPLDAWAAYAQSAVVYTSLVVDGKKCTVAAYTETENAAASTAVISIDFTHGTVRSIHQDRTAGAAATLNPSIGRLSTWTVGDMNHVLTATSTADPIYEQGATHFYASLGKLYVRSGVNAGSDNSISTEIIICAGAP